MRIQSSVIYLLVLVAGLCACQKATNDEKLVERVGAEKQSVSAEDIKLVRFDLGVAASAEEKCKEQGTEVVCEAAYFHGQQAVRSLEQICKNDADYCDDYASARKASENFHSKKDQYLNSRNNGL